MFRKAIKLEEEVRHRQNKMLIAQLDQCIIASNDKDKVISSQKKKVAELTHRIEKMEMEQLSSVDSCKNTRDLLDHLEDHSEELKQHLQKVETKLEKSRNRVHFLDVNNRELEGKVEALENELNRVRNSRGDLTPRPNLTKVDHLFGNAKVLTTKQKISHLVYLLKKNVNLVNNK